MIIRFTLKRFLCAIVYAIVATTNIFVQMVKQSKLQKIRIGILNILNNIKLFPWKLQLDNIRYYKFLSEC